MGGGGCRRRPWGPARCPPACWPPPALPVPLQELRAAGREPYAYTFPRTHTAAQLQELHAGLGEGQVAEGASVAVAGRVMSRRFMGKLAFFKLVDASGSIQVRRWQGPVHAWPAPTQPGPLSCAADPAHSLPLPPPATRSSLSLTHTCHPRHAAVH